MFQLLWDKCGRPFTRHLLLRTFFILQLSVQAIFQNFQSGPIAADELVFIPAYWPLFSAVHSRCSFSALSLSYHCVCVCDYVLNRFVGYCATPLIPWVSSCSLSTLFSRPFPLGMVLNYLPLLSFTLLFSQALYMFARVTFLLRSSKVPPWVWGVLVMANMLIIISVAWELLESLAVLPLSDIPYRMSEGSTIIFMFLAGALAREFVQQLRRLQEFQVFPPP